MRRVFLSFLLVLLGAFAGFSQTPTPSPSATPLFYIPVKWEVAKPEQCECKIAFPGKVVDNRQPNAFVSGETQFEYAVPTDYILFKLGFSKFPIKIKYDDDAVMKPFLEKYVASLAKNENMTILRQAFFKVGDATAIEVAFAEGEIIHVNRYIYRKERFFMLTTSGYKETDADPGMKGFRQKFFDSFQFIN